jgi:hypothetical protein
MFIDLNKFSLFLLLFGSTAFLYSCNSSTDSDKKEDTISTRSLNDSKEGEDIYADFFKDPFESVDDHALHSTPEVEKEISSLALYLQDGCKNDLEKARSVYVWLARNINYDVNGYNNASYGDASAKAVLNSRTAVCEGFSNLYAALGNEMGLEIEVVKGYAKGYGFANVASFSQTNHAWNRIKIDGKWRIFDATWGEGYAENIGGRIACTKSFDNYWFNVDPYRAVFDHYPKGKLLDEIKPAIDMKTFCSLPKVNKNYFRLGFDAHLTYQKILKNNKATFPKCYDVKTPVRILKAPPQKNLVAGKTYQFKLVIPAALKVALMDEHTNWNYMKEDENGAWLLSYTPKDPGKINILLNNGGKSFAVMMSYSVVKADSQYDNLNS